MEDYFMMNTTTFRTITRQHIQDNYECKRNGWVRWEKDNHVIEQSDICMYSGRTGYVISDNGDGSYLVHLYEDERGYSEMETNLKAEWLIFDEKN